MPTLTFKEGPGNFGSTYDTWIEEANPTASHEGDGFLYVSSKAGERRITLLHWPDFLGEDVNQVPFNAAIVSARIVLRTASDGGTGVNGAKLNAYLIHRPWYNDSDPLCTWNNRVTGTPWSGAGVSGTTGALPDRSPAPSHDGEPLNPFLDSQSYAIPITRLVRAWTARLDILGTVPRPAYGVALIMDPNVEATVIFHSSEASLDPYSVTLVPYLEVSYESSVHSEIDIEAQLKLASPKVSYFDTFIDELNLKTPSGSATRLQYSNYNSESTREFEFFNVEDWHHAEFQSLTTSPPSYREDFLVTDWETS